MESYFRCSPHDTRKDINSRWKAVYAKLISIYIAKLRLSLRIDLGPVYKEKSFPGQESHPPSRVNFTARLYEEKVDPSARAKSQELAHALIVSL